MRYNILSLLILVSTFSMAQKTIIGKVTDTEGSPLPYATISAMSVDSSWLTGASTDDNGEFSITLNVDQVILEVSFLSFESQTLGPLELMQRETNLGNLTLSQANMTLDEVVVATEKSQVEFKLDKRVFNVGKDINNVGGNATDILDNIPGITVDVEGGVELRGSGNVRILINGQPSTLTSGGDNNALRQLQASMIERVEVITNPSARYEAEGEVGIINIILKKNREKGVNGSIDVNTGFPHNHGLGLNLNYRRNRLNLFTNIGGNFRRGPGQGSGEQYFLDETGSLTGGFLTDRDHNRGGISGNFQLGMDYYFNPKTWITLSGSYSYGDEQNNTDIRYTDLDEQLNVTRITTRADREEEIDHDAEGRFNFTREFAGEDHKWTIDVNFQITDDTETSSFKNRDADQEIFLEQRSINGEDERLVIVQSDYVYPFAEDGRFEAGVRASYREVENAFLVEELDDNNEWNVFDEFNDAMLYTEGIYAGYLIFGNKIEKFGFQLGLRAEYSDILTELTESEQRNPRDYLNWFPSTHLSYDINQKNQLQLSFSRRISRPRYRHLLPFSTFSDNRNLRQGNPDLNPEYSNSFEGGWLRYFESGSILTSIYYRHRTDLIQRIREVIDEDVTLSKPINLGTQDAYGLEVGFNYDLTKWWNANVNVNGYYAETTGQFEEENFDVTALSFNTRLNFKFKLPEGFDVQSTLDYRAPENVPQGKRLAVYTWNLGASKDILNKKGSITLRVSDVLNSRFWRSETEGPDFFGESEFQWRARTVILGFNYQINRQTRQKGRSGKGDADSGMDLDLGG